MSMLNAHSAIAFPPEFHFVRNYLLASTTLRRAHLLTALESDAYFDRLGLEAEEVVGEGDGSEDAVDLIALYKRILARFASRKGAAYAGDKDPKNIEHLPLIAALFERPYVVHVIRDPRDVYRSRTKAGWAKGRSRISHLLAYRAQFVMGRKGAELFGNRYVEVRYEDLVTKPEATLKDLCDRLGLPFESQMLSHEQSARELVAEDELQWKGSALLPIMQDNAGKWRQAGFDTDLVLAIEAGCSPAFTSSLYQRSLEPSSISEKALAFGWDRLLSSVAWLYIQAVGRREKAALRRIAARQTD